MRASALILSLSLSALIAGAAPLAAAWADDSPTVEQAKRDGRAVGQGTRDTAIAVGDGVESTANKVGDGVETTANKVGHGIRDTAIQVGHGIETGAHAVGAGFESAWNSLTGKDDKAR